MAALTTLQKITIAKISEYLVSVAIQKGNRSLDVTLPEKLYNIRKTIEYQYGKNPSDSTLTLTSNYLYALCAFSLQAQGILLNPGTTAGVIARTTPTPYQFTVDASTSFIINGQSTKTITSFIGFNLLFIRNYVPQGTVDPGGGQSFYGWDKVAGIFTCTPSAVTTEFFQLFPI
jgi:hypothetical protein